MKPHALSRHTLSLWHASRCSTSVAHTAEIEHRSRQRVVPGISCCALVIATALIVGCGGGSSSSGSGNSNRSLSSSNGISSGSWIGMPQQPSASLQEPSTAIQAPGTVVQEPSTPVQEPSAPIEEPSPPPEEPSAPIQEPSPVQCGSGMAARDLTGQCRASPATPGALEVIDGTNATTS